MALNTDLVQQVAELVIKEIGSMGYAADTSLPKLVPVGISARHVHLQPDHLEALFGKGHKLKPIKDLTQPGQYAAEETVCIIGTKGKIERVRILGPERSCTQVEISASDARVLGIKPVVRCSGDHHDTPGIIIVGPVGSIEIKSGVILADRHIHMTPDDSVKFDVKDGEKVRVVVPGEKGGVMNNVTIRVDKNYRLDMHIDTDDANAFLISQGDILEFEKYINGTGDKY